MDIVASEVHLRDLHLFCRWEPYESKLSTAPINFNGAKWKWNAPNYNAIRNRAGLPNLPAGLTQEEMRNRIKHERRIELAFETHRFFDVRRWLDAERTECKPVYSMNIYAGTSLQDTEYYQRIKIEDRVFEAPKHYFFPISQTEINKNQKGRLVQNLGWITQKVEE